MVCHAFCVKSLQTKPTIALYTVYLHTQKTQKYTHTQQWSKRIMCHSNSRTFTRSEVFINLLLWQFIALSNSGGGDGGGGSDWGGGEGDDGIKIATSTTELMTMFHLIDALTVAKCELASGGWSGCLSFSIFHINAQNGLSLIRFLHSIWRHAKVVKGGKIAIFTS